MKSRMPNTSVNEILDSLDNIQKAAAPDFFYTRLLGRMQNRMGEGKKIIFFLRPAFLTAALSVVLLVNVIALQRLNTPQKASNEKTGTIESFADAYNLNTNTVY